MQKGGYVYILTNKNKTTIYIGVASNLISRINQHKDSKNTKSFSYRYNLYFLVYYEFQPDIVLAIAREKEIKKWRREKKNNLINQYNPEWKDLYYEICP